MYVYWYIFRLAFIFQYTEQNHNNNHNNHNNNNQSSSLVFDILMFIVKTCTLVRAFYIKIFLLTIIIQINYFKTILKM